MSARLYFMTGHWPVVKDSDFAHPVPSERDSEEGAARRTLALAILRGALLDLLATADHDRVTAAVRHQLALFHHRGAAVPRP